MIAENGNRPRRQPARCRGAARRACQTGGGRRVAPVSVTAEWAYLSGTGGARSWFQRDEMARISRLHHDIDLAQRATVALPAGLVLAVFLLLAAGVTIYDLGKWLAIW
jgi:hypothetical protein